MIYEPGTPSRIIGADMLLNECAVSVVEVLGQLSVARSQHGVGTVCCALLCHRLRLPRTPVLLC